MNKMLLTFSDGAICHIAQDLLKVPFEVFEFLVYLIGPNLGARNHCPIIRADRLKTDHFRTARTRNVPHIFKVSAVRKTFQFEFIVPYFKWIFAAFNRFLTVH